MTDRLVAHFRAMARNNAWANDRLLEACRASTPPPSPPRASASSPRCAGRSTTSTPSTSTTSTRWRRPAAASPSSSPPTPTSPSPPRCAPPRPPPTAASSPSATASRPPTSTAASASTAATRASSPSASTRSSPTSSSTRSTTAARPTPCSPAPPSRRRSSTNSSSTTTATRARSASGGPWVETASNNWLEVNCLPTPEACGRAQPAKSPANRSRSTFFCTFPMAFRGSSSTTATCFGSLNPASCPRSAATTSPGAPVDDRHHRLAEVRMRHAHHRALDHPRQRVDRLLDLLGIDVQPPGDDQILRPPDDGDIAVRLDPRHVAGDEEPVRPHLLRRLLRQPPVAGEDVRPPHLEHPHLARRQLPPVRPADPELDPRQGLPHRPRPPLPAERVGRVHPRLGHPVALEDPLPRPRLELLVRARQQRRRARDEEPHPRRRLARQRRAGEKPRVERRHPHQQRRPPHQPDHPLRLELRQQDHPPAVQQHQVQRHEEPVGVIERQRVDQHVVRPEPPEPCSVAVFDQRLSFVSIAPFERPVVPEV